MPERKKTLIIAIMVIVGVMSGFLSNTGTAAVLIPVVCGIADESGYSRSRLLMPLVFAAALGGNLSIIGAPGNLMGVNALQEMGLSTSFFMYAPVGVPMLLIGILYFVLIGYKFLPDGKNASGAALEDQQDFSHVPKWKQTVSLVVLILVILAMIFEKEIGISIEVSACIGAILLVLTGVISEKDALKSIDLKVVFLFGGSLTLAKALDTTGAGELIADKIVGLLGADPSPILLLLVIFYCNLCADKFHVKYSNHSTDDSNCGISCKQPRSRSESRCYRNCYRRFLCICNTDRYAGKHHGSRSWRIQIQGLCEIRSAVDSGILCDLYDPVTDPVSVLPVRRETF